MTILVFWWLLVVMITHNFHVRPWIPTQLLLLFWSVIVTSGQNIVKTWWVVVELISIHNYINTKNKNVSYNNGIIEKGTNLESAWCWIVFFFITWLLLRKNELKKKKISRFLNLPLWKMNLYGAKVLHTNPYKRKIYYLSKVL